MSTALNHTVTSHLLVQTPNSFLPGGGKIYSIQVETFSFFLSPASLTLFSLDLFRAWNFLPFCVGALLRLPCRVWSIAERSQERRRRRTLDHSSQPSYFQKPKPSRSSRASRSVAEPAVLCSACCCAVLCVGRIHPCS